jgi:copper chaperone
VYRDAQQTYVGSRYITRFITRFLMLQLTVPSMACASCAAAIARAVQELDPQAKVQGDPATKQVTITTQAPEAAVREAIESAGFPVG